MTCPIMWQVNLVTCPIMRQVNLVWWPILLCGRWIWCPIPFSSSWTWWPFQLCGRWTWWPVLSHYRAGENLLTCPLYNGWTWWPVPLCGRWTWWPAWWRWWSRTSPRTRRRRMCWCRSWRRCPSPSAPTPSTSHSLQVSPPNPHLNHGRVLPLSHKTFLWSELVKY